MTRIEDQDEDVYVQLFDFGRNTCVSEAVVLNDDGSYTIFVSSRLSTERQRQVIEHALGHIAHGDFRKHDVQQIESEAHGLTVPEPIEEDPMMKRYEEMRKKNARARKRIQKQLARKQKQVEYLMETDAEYRREHKIFEI